jgi:CBS domain-containing protein
MDVPVAIAEDVEQAMKLIVYADATILDAAKTLTHAPNGTVAVMDGHDRLTGLLSARSVLAEVVATGRDAATTYVRELDLEPTFAAAPLDRVDETLAAMTARDVKCVVVLSHPGHVLDFVSMERLSKLSADGFPDPAPTLSFVLDPTD